MEVVNCILHKLHTVSTIEGALTEELNISDRNFEIKNIGKGTMNTWLFSGRPYTRSSIKFTKTHSAGRCTIFPPSLSNS